jgi:hypothetical protein
MRNKFGIYEILLSVIIFGKYDMEVFEKDSESYLRICSLSSTEFVVVAMIISGSETIDRMSSKEIS